MKAHPTQPREYGPAGRPHWRRLRDHRFAIGLVKIEAHWAICFGWWYFGTIRPSAKADA